MKAAVIETPGTIKIRELAMPEPGDYGALCEMLYGATCSGTDSHLLHGRLPWLWKYPTVFGHESIGRVVTVGEKVRNLRIGDLVTRVGLRRQDCLDAGLNWNWGGFCTHGVAMDYRAMREDGFDQGEYNAFRVHHVLPTDIDPRAATMIITWRETLSYLLRMGIRPGTSVLVLGSGGVGLSFIRLTKILGANVAATVGNADREEQARRAGADIYVDYKNVDWEKSLQEQGEFDFIIDSVASRDGLGRALCTLRPGGTCGVYGIVTDRENPPTVMPTNSRGFTYFPCGYDEEETNDQVIELVKAGELDAKIWIDLENPYALDEIASAYAELAKKSCIKILIQLG